MSLHLPDRREIRADFFNKDELREEQDFFIGYETAYDKSFS